jgi:putative endonuclease
MRFYAYILKSEKTGRYYFGHCKDLSARLEYHNKGKVKSTKSGRPWILYYNEQFLTKAEAYRRELFFKSFDGRKWLYENKILKATD